MADVELKPCPFCGGEAGVARYGDRRQSTIYYCLDCGCRLETSEEWDHGKDWNKRAILGRDDTEKYPLEEVCELPNGCTLYRQENAVGGHTYWSDEIGGGVMAWDTALVDRSTILAAMVDQDKLAYEAARKKERK